MKPDRDQYLKFRRPHDQCLLCGTSLPSAGRHPTVLEFDDKEEAVRRDFCPACWQKAGNPGYFSFWVTKRISGPTAAERRLAKHERNEAFWRLFLALHGAQTDEYRTQLFLLAHLLMRYRVMTFKGTGPDGTLMFEAAPTGETYRIADVPEGSAEFGAIMKSVEDQAVQLMESVDDGPAVE